MSHSIYIVFAVISLAGFGMFGRELWLTGKSGTVIAERTMLAFGSRDFRPIDIDLDPSMNPLRFNVTVRTGTTLLYVKGRENLYGKLVLAGRTADSHVYSFHDDPDSFSRVAASAWTSVDQPGRYRYEGSASHNGRWLSAIDVKISRNARPLEWKSALLWLGVFIVAAILGEVIGERPPFMARAAEKARE